MEQFFKFQDIKKSFGKALEPDALCKKFKLV